MCVCVCFTPEDPVKLKYEVFAQIRGPNTPLVDKETHLNGFPTIAPRLEEKDSLLVSPVAWKAHPSDTRR